VERRRRWRRDASAQLRRTGNPPAHGRSARGTRATPTEVQRRELAAAWLSSRVRRSRLGTTRSLAGSADGRSIRQQVEPARSCAGRRYVSPEPAPRGPRFAADRRGALHIAGTRRADGSRILRRRMVHTPCWTGGAHTAMPGAGRRSLAQLGRSARKLPSADATHCCALRRSDRPRRVDRTASGFRINAHRQRASEREAARLASRNARRDNVSASIKSRHDTSEESTRSLVIFISGTTRPARAVALGGSNGVPHCPERNASHHRNTTLLHLGLPRGQYLTRRQTQHCEATPSTETPASRRRAKHRAGQRSRASEVVRRQRRTFVGWPCFHTPAVGLY